MSNTVRLIPAFAFTCEECGRESFMRAIARDFSEEDEKELRDDHGIQPYDLGEFVMCPTKVICQHCGQMFGVNYE